jgi:hypothetical protein
MAYIEQYPVWVPHVEPRGIWIDETQFPISRTESIPLDGIPNWIAESVTVERPLEIHMYARPPVTVTRLETGWLVSLRSQQIQFTLKQVPDLKRCLRGIVQSAYRINRMGFNN